MAESIAFRFLYGFSITVSIIRVDDNSIILLVKGKMIDFFAAL